MLFIGDFNSILSPNLDRPRAPKQYSAELYNWAQVTGVIEIWRWKNPEKKRVYSCYSASYKISSQIDLVFADPALLVDIVEATYLPSGLLDHSLLLLSISTPALKNASLWRMAPQWVLYPEKAEKNGINISGILEK